MSPETGPAAAPADPERGPAARQRPEDLLAALSLPTRGVTYSLSVPRTPACRCSARTRRSRSAMARTPAGLRGDGVQPWGPRNEVNLGYMAELVSGTSHSGAHVDALAHMTIGEDDHWYGGGNAREHLATGGPSGVTVQAAPVRHPRGAAGRAGPPRVEALPAHEPVMRRGAAGGGGGAGHRGARRRRRPHPVRLPEPVARPRGAGPARHRRPRHQRRPVAAGPGRRRGGQRHGDLRGAAGPRPRSRPTRSRCTPCC